MCVSATSDIAWVSTAGIERVTGSGEYGQAATPVQKQQTVRRPLPFVDKDLRLSCMKVRQIMKLFVIKWHAIRYGFSLAWMASGMSSQRGRGCVAWGRGDSG